MHSCFSCPGAGTAADAALQWRGMNPDALWDQDPSQSSGIPGVSASSDFHRTRAPPSSRRPFCGHISWAPRASSSNARWRRCHHSSPRSHWALASPAVCIRAPISSAQCRRRLVRRRALPLNRSASGSAGFWRRRWTGATCPCSGEGPAPEAWGTRRPPSSGRAPTPQPPEIAFSGPGILARESRALGLQPPTAGICVPWWRPREGRRWASQIQRPAVRIRGLGWGGCRRESPAGWSMPARGRHRWAQGSARRGGERGRRGTTSRGGWVNGGAGRRDAAISCRRGPRTRGAAVEGGIGPEEVPRRRGVRWGPGHHPAAEDPPASWGCGGRRYGSWRPHAWGACSGTRRWANQAASSSSAPAGVPAGDWASFYVPGQELLSGAPNASPHRFLLRAPAAATAFGGGSAAPFPSPPSTAILHFPRFPVETAPI